MFAILQRRINNYATNAGGRFAYKGIAVSILLLPALGIDKAQAQTCIVIRRTPKSIVAAADSKETHSRIYDGRIIPDADGLKCKIRQVDPFVFYALSGQYNFDVDAIAVESCRSGGAAYLEKITAFEQAVRGPLIKHLEELKTNIPGIYNQNFINARKPAIQIVIFGMENSIPAFVTMSLVVKSGLASVPSSITDPFRFSEPFRVNEPVALTTYIDGCPLKHPATESVMRALGRTEVIAGIAWQENKFWKWLGDIEGAVFLVRLETLAASENVGEPIDAIYVDTQGASWKYHKPECAEIQLPNKKSTSVKPLAKQKSRKRR